MNLLKKTLCILLLGFIATEIFPQRQFYISTNGNIDNSFLTSSIYNVSTITPLKNKNSSKVLDSLLCIFLDGNRIKITYNYNDDLSLIYYTFADWFNGKWIISDKRTNTYNSDGNLESVLWEWFNPALQEWLNHAKGVYNYDSLGNMIYYLHQYFNGQEFENAFKYENCYDTANNLVSSVNQDWIDSIWVNRSKSVYTYTPENVNDTTLFQVWTNDKWVNYQLNIYEYDEKINIISNLAKRWQKDNWLDLGMGRYKYDINNNRVLETWEIVNNNTWENWFRIFYEYDDNNLIHLFGEEWLNGQWVPENEPLRVTNPDGTIIGFLANEIFLYYGPLTSVGSENNIANAFNLLQNYPNPFNPVTHIDFMLMEEANVTLKVFNALGQEVKTLVNEEMIPGYYSRIFDRKDLPSGVYFYRLNAGSFSETKKMILLR